MANFVNVLLFYNDYNHTTVYFACPGRGKHFLQPTFSAFCGPYSGGYAGPARSKGGMIFLIPRIYHINMN